MTGTSGYKTCQSSWSSYEIVGGSGGLLKYSARTLMPTYMKSENIPLVWGSAEEYRLYQLQLCGNLECRIGKLQQETSVERRIWTQRESGTVG